MKEHPDDGTLLARLDGELSVGAREEVRRHVDACGPCRTRLEELRAAATALSRAVARIDRPPPRADLSDVVEAHRRRTAGAPDPEESSRRPRAPGGRRALARGLGGAWLKAAVLLLTLAGAAAAIPGSPVRGWIERALQGPGEPPADVGEPAAPDGQEPAGAGVSVPLVDGHVVIRLDGAAPGTRVRVRLVDGPEATVSATGGSYRTAPGRVELEGPEGGPVSIRVPSTATARIEVDGRPVVLKEGAGFRLLVPSADTTGTEIQFSVGARGRTSGEP